MIVRITAVAIAALALGCASAPSSGTAGRSRNTITAEEIHSVNRTSLYDVVQALRPEFLRGRGQQTLGNASSTEVVVYLDGVRAGGPEMLQRLTPDSAIEIRYLDARDATTLYGTGHTSGAILVKTR
jgi:hypothetical protein